MEFDLRLVDPDAPAVVPDATFQCVSKQGVTLEGVDSFESAPDDEPEGDAREGSKASRFAQLFKEGKDAESRFLAACARQGWTSVPTSVFDDRVRRIDCVIRTSRGFFIVDVKGAKRLRRSDPEPQFRFHWLELHSTGSLFSGESKVLALEVAPGRFALFDKMRIRSWIRPRMGSAAPVASPSQALFRPYQRFGKVKEWITLVDITEMLGMCEGIIE